MDKQRRAPEPIPVYDPERPTGFANPRPTGDGDPSPKDTLFRQGFFDPDAPAPDPEVPANQS